MRIRQSAALVFALVLIGVGAFWVSSVADTPEKLMLPQTENALQPCPTEDGSGTPHQEHQVQINGLGTFQENGTFQGSRSGDPTPPVVKIGRQYKSKTGQKVVPLRIISIGGHGFAEGIGETRFWLDPTRPVRSAIWEKKPGTEFPAIQEMRFHFFYTLEAMPGKIFRSINPARMRSNDVRAFPPPAGTVYRLAAPVNLEEVSEPGVVVGQVLANRLVMPKHGA
jgi:hypothetical protein